MPRKIVSDFAGLFGKRKKKSERSVSAKYCKTPANVTPKHYRYSNLQLNFGVKFCASASVCRPVYHAIVVASILRIRLYILTLLGNRTFRCLKLQNSVILCQRLHLTDGNCVELCQSFCLRYSFIDENRIQIFQIGQTHELRNIGIVTDISL